MMVCRAADAAVKSAEESKHLRIRFTYCQQQAGVPLLQPPQPPQSTRLLAMIDGANRKSVIREGFFALDNLFVIRLAEEAEEKRDALQLAVNYG